MPSTQKGKELLATIKENIMATLVSGILRQEQPKSDAAIKRIALTTGLDQNNIAKWYNGRNAPKSANLLKLAKPYPNMLRMILERIGRSDVWELCVQHGIPQKMLSERQKTFVRQSINSDRYVSINVVVDALVGSKLNKRQLWFLGRLQQGNKIKADDIVAAWRVDPRSARRDIAGLVKNHLIRFAGARKNGKYELCRRKRRS